MDDFTIDGNTIDFGTEGRFAPGSEARMKALLQKKEDGEKIFASLLSRGKIKLKAKSETSKSAPKKEGNSDDKPVIPNRGEGESGEAGREEDSDTKDSTEGDPGEKEVAGTDSKADDEDEGADSDADAGDGTDSDDSEEALKYEPTGKYEFDHYGGGNCHIIDPEGNVIDRIRPIDAAEKHVAELNSNL